jgi:RNA polymerase subunit RPABC4/transcription elongation factor Spt4
MSHWRVYGEDTVACRLSKTELPGFFRKRVTVGPGESAAVIKNGKVEKIVTESRESIGGIGDKLASWFGGGCETDVIFFDNGPIEFSLFSGQQTSSSAAVKGGVSMSADGALEIRRELSAADLSISLLTADSVELSAVCIFRVAIDPDSAAALLRLMSKREVLASWDLAAFVKSEMLAKVLIPEVASVNSAVFRSDRVVAERIERSAMDKLAASLASIGFVLHDFSVTWGATQAEQAAVIKRQAEVEDDLAAFTHQRVICEMNRETELDRIRLQNLQELKTAGVQGDNDLQALLLSGEINRDQMVANHRVDLARVDAEIQMIQINVDDREAKMRLERDRISEIHRLEVEEKELRLRMQEADADSHREMSEMERLVALKTKMDAEKHLKRMAERRQEIDAEFRRHQAELDARRQERQAKLQEDLARMGMLERIVAQGLSGGQADSSVLNTLLQEATKQGFANVSDAKVASMYDAETAKNNMNGYQQAEDRERMHQAQMSGLAANMMQAAKQQPAGVMPVMMAGAMPSAARAEPSAVNVHVAQPFHPPNSTMANACSRCSQPIQAGWKACPFCGELLGSPACRNCEGKLQPGWKACPACGTAV